MVSLCFFNFPTFYKTLPIKHKFATIKLETFMKNVWMIKGILKIPQSLTFQCKGIIETDKYINLLKC